MFCNCRRLLIISSITKQKHFQGRYVCWRCQWWFSFHGPVYLDFIVAFNECVSYLTKCLTSSQLTAHDLEQILAAHTTLNTWPRTQRASPHTKSRSDYADIKREKREWQETKRKVTTCTPPSKEGSLFITRLLWFNVGDYTCGGILCSPNVSIVQFADILNQITSISDYKSLPIKAPSIFPCPLIHVPSLSNDSPSLFTELWPFCSLLCDRGVTSHQYKWIKRSRTQLQSGFNP